MASQIKKKPAGGTSKAPTSAKGWKKATEVAGTDLDLPSGNVCRVKRPGLQTLMAEDLVPDSLLPLAEDAVQRGKKGAPAQASAASAEIMRDKAMIKDVFLTMDRVAEMCILKPRVVHHREQNESGEWIDIADEERLGDDDEEKDFLYTDEIDLNDKLFIFQFVVGGTRDLEKFRRETGMALVDVSPGEDVEDEAV